MSSKTLELLEQLKEEFSLLETISYDLDFRCALSDMVEQSDYSDEFYENDVLAELDSTMNRYYTQMGMVKDKLTDLENELLE